MALYPLVTVAEANSNREKKKKRLRCNLVSLVTICQVVMESKDEEREDAPLFSPLLSSGSGLIVLLQLLLQSPV